MKSAPKSSDGFTLIELLLALAVFSAIAASLSGIFAAGISLWKRWGTNNQMEQESRAILLKMAQELRNALPYQGVFSGTAERISFFTSWQEPSAEQNQESFVSQQALAQITYQSALDASFGRVVEKAQRIFFNDRPGATFWKQSLTSFPTRFSLEYGFREGAKGSATILWKDSAKIFPEAVKIHLILQEENGNPPLDLTEVVELLTS